MGDEDAESVPPAVDENSMTDLGAPAVAGEKVVAVLNAAAQGIATEVDGAEPEKDEVQDAGDKDRCQDVLARGAHGRLSGVWDRGFMG